MENFNPIPSGSGIHVRRHTGQNALHSRDDSENNIVRGNSSHISSTSNQSAATSSQAQRVETPEEVNEPSNSSISAH